MLAPASGSRGSNSSAPARVPAPIPPRPLPERSPAQPSPDRIRFRTLTAVAKDRRTPHHRLKIRPPFRAETQDTGSALPVSRVGWGSGAGWRAGPGIRALDARPLAGGGLRAWPPGPRRGLGTPWSPRLPGKNLRGGETRARVQDGSGRHRDDLLRGPLWSCRQAAESRRELTFKRLGSRPADGKSSEAGPHGGGSRTRL